MAGGRVLAGGGARAAVRRAAPYLRPFPRYHVRIRWRDRGGSSVEVRGPVCLVAGRYCGLGLFTAELPGRP